MKKQKIKISDVNKHRQSRVGLFRKGYKKKGKELIDITKLCETKIDCHGSCNGFNEPEENIYHIKILYRDGVIASCGAHGIFTIYEDKYAIFNGEYQDEPDFIIFRVVDEK